MVSRETKKENFIRYELDPIRQLWQNASEEYGQTLEEFERLFGEKAREEYEEKYV